MEILPNGMTMFPVNLAKTRGIAGMILNNLADGQIEVGAGVAACSLAVARLLSPGKMTVKDEQKFLTAFMEWVGTYWAEGGEN